MEYAVDARWISNEAEARRWLLGCLENTVQCLDLPVFLRLFDSVSKERGSRFRFWQNFLLASRETKEARSEEASMGRSLRRIVLDLSEDDGGFAHRAVTDSSTFVGAFAAATALWKVDRQNAAAGLCWTWCEQRTAALIRLVPLGQTQGQRLLADAAASIPQIVANAQLHKNRQIGGSLPAASLASMLHETQYTRLFLS